MVYNVPSFVCKYSVLGAHTGVLWENTGGLWEMQGRSQRAGFLGLLFRLFPKFPKATATTLVEKLDTALRNGCKKLLDRLASNMQIL